MRKKEKLPKFEKLSVLSTKNVDQIAIKIYQ